jgi:hypothetical protein
MKKLGIIGLVLTAMCALGAVAVATASAALPEVLAAAFPVAATGLSGEGLLESSAIAAPIKCKSSTGEGEITGKSTGTAHTDFKECTLEGEACTGLGEAAGVILVLGEAHTVFLKLGTGTALTVGILGTINEVHFECKFLSLLLRAKGNAIGEVTPTNTRTKSFTGKLEQAKGNNKLVKYWNEAGTEEIGTSLLVSVGTGAFALAGIEVKEGKSTTASEIEIMG